MYHLSAQDESIHVYYFLFFVWVFFFKQTYSALSQTHPNAEVEWECCWVLTPCRCKTEGRDQTKHAHGEEPTHPIPPSHKLCKNGAFK